MYRYLQVRRDGAVEHVTLSRPDVRNAFNDEVVAELRQWADGLHQDPGVRVVVLAGAGKVFSAGADAAWMARMADASEAENERDALSTTAMLRAINTLPVVVIGRIHGAALGGGSGLAAVCDIVVAEEGAVFGFTETKLGILPAMISPFVLPKIGVSHARALFLTGARFDAAKALAIGLVHTVVPAGQLDAAVAEVVREALTAAPTGVAAAKRLIPQVTGRAPEDVASLTAKTIAAQRVSPEGQDGLRAFLEKRQPGWVPR
ncbi:MAG: enoyl-CoA hydratase/isomerase family protein [Acidobacteria bacterium]|nr:enoyl-CoA hydratase/isomerase family protein [Acidobacteriota bacterium]